MVHGSDVTEDVLEGVGTELQTPHKLDEVCVNYNPCNATFFLIAPFCQHPHVLDFVCVGTRHWIDEVERLVNCLMRVTMGAGHVVRPPQIRRDSRSWSHVSRENRH